MKQQGFTLIEIVIMLSIVGIVGLVLSQSFVSSVRTNTSGEIRQEVKQGGGFAIDTISRMLLQSRGTTEVCSAEGARYESLTLQNPDGGTTTIDCRADTNNLLRIASSSATATEYLTGSEVELAGTTCSGLIEFTCQSIGDGQKRVTVKFTLRQKNTNANAFESASTEFQTTVTTRN